MLPVPEPAAVSAGGKDAIRILVVQNASAEAKRKDCGAVRSGWTRWCVLAGQCGGRCLAWGRRLWRHTVAARMEGAAPALEHNDFAAWQREASAQGNLHKVAYYYDAAPAPAASTHRASASEARPDF